MNPIESIMRPLRAHQEQRSLKLMLPDGWTIEEDIDRAVKRKILFGIPVRPITKESKDQADQWEETLASRSQAQQTLMLIVRNQFTREWRDWDLGPIFIEDLDKDPDVLLAESYTLKISKEPDPFLVAMKLRAFRARGGQVPQVDLSK